MALAGLLWIHSRKKHNRAFSECVVARMCLQGCLLPCLRCFSLGCRDRPLLVACAGCGRATFVCAFCPRRSGCHTAEGVLPVREFTSITARQVEAVGTASSFRKVVCARAYPPTLQCNDSLQGARVLRFRAEELSNGDVPCMANSILCASVAMLLWEVERPAPVPCGSSGCVKCFNNAWCWNCSTCAVFKVCNRTPAINSSAEHETADNAAKAGYQQLCSMPPRTQRAQSSATHRTNKAQFTASEGKAPE